MEEDREFYARNRQDKDAGKIIDVDRLRQNSRYDTARRVRLLRAMFRPSQRLLDVGVGYGFLVESGFAPAIGDA